MTDFMDASAPEFSVGAGSSWGRDSGFVRESAYKPESCDGPGDGKLVMIYFPKSVRGGRESFRLYRVNTFWNREQV